MTTTATKSGRSRAQTTIEPLPDNWSQTLVPGQSGGNFTPRMISMMINEKRRVTRNAVVSFDPTRAAAFHLALIYSDNGDPRGTYRGAVIAAVVTNNNERMTPIKLDSWLHPKDLKKVTSAREALQGHIKIQKPNYELAGARQILGGFYKQQGNQRSVWVTGLLDQLGYQLGVFQRAIPYKFSTKEECDEFKSRVRTGDPALNGVYKLFRAHVYQRLVPQISSLVQATLRPRVTVKPRRNIRPIPTRTTRTAPTESSDNVKTKIAAILRNAERSMTVRKVCDALTTSGHVFTYKNPMDEVRHTLVTSPQLFRRVPGSRADVPEYILESNKPNTRPVGRRRGN
jgi:hypothetical protein